MFVLRLPQGRPFHKPVDTMMALRRRGMTALRAKRAIDALKTEGRVFVDLPTLEDPRALAQELAEAGVASALVPPPEKPDVRALRERLHLTREQFAIRYGLEVETVRNWETGKRDMDATARSYLRVIANDPEHVEQAYAPTPA